MCASRSLAAILCTALADARPYAAVSSGHGTGSVGQQLLYNRSSSTEKKLFIALCVCGKSDVFVNTRVRLHWKEVFAPLLHESVQFDVFLHLTAGTSPLVNDANGNFERAMAASVSAVHFELHPLETEEHQHRWVNCTTWPEGTSKGKSFRGASRCSRAHGGLLGERCFVNQVYDSYQRWHYCLRSIERREMHQLHRKYDFVLKVRPDVEYFKAVPHAAEWHKLRRNVTWVEIAIQGTKTYDKWGVTSRLADRVTSVEDIQFIGDNLALLSRFGANYFLSAADQIELCHDSGPNSSSIGCQGFPPTTTSSPWRCKSTCFQRASWGECRVLDALHDLGENIGELPFGREFAVVECVDARCNATRRRSIGPPYHMPQVYAKNPTFLTTVLKASHFPPSSYV